MKLLLSIIATMTIMQCSTNPVSAGHETTDSAELVRVVLDGNEFLSGSGCTRGQDRHVYADYVLVAVVDHDSQRDTIKVPDGCMMRCTFRSTCGPDMIVDTTASDGMVWFVGRL